jgi:CheY-like chemotaxis protein
LDFSRSVLVVDESEETRQVLKTVLEPRGLRVLEATAADQGLEMAHRFHPDVIVLDSELDRSAGTLPGRFNPPDSDPTPLVVLGTVRQAGLPTGQFLAKPYHYAPLIRKIEELLDSVR